MFDEKELTSAAAVRAGGQPTHDACLYRLLKLQADQSPNAVAIAGVGRAPLTYIRLCGQIEYTVKTLNSIGIRRNDRIVLVLPNGPEMAVACIAVGACATAALLNPAYRENEFDSYLADLNAKALIVQSGVASPAIAVAEERGIPLFTLSPMLEAEAGVFTVVANVGSGQFPKATTETEDVVLEDVVLILHTSGTTSRPKLVPLTQANICASARKVQAALEIASDDRYLNVMPLFHTQGVMLTIASLLEGASVVCTPGFSAAEFFKWIEEFRPTWYSAAPAIHQAILSQSGSNREIMARYPLRMIRSAASPLSPYLMAELERTFRCPVIEGYGMTECYPITSNPLPPSKRIAGSVGIAAGTEVAVIDEAGKLLPLGETGEIVVSGPHVMAGYLNDSANTNNTFIDDRFRTGDQGYMDADGYLFVTGRLKEMINRGGEKISPWEVEEVLLEHSAVADAVSFAVPHLTLGEEVGAAVVLRDKASATERDLQVFAANRLAEFKIPRRLLIVQQIPKSATGKVKRIGLAEKLGLKGADQAPRANNGVPVAPRTSLEKEVAKIWAQVLGIAMVGIHDNFFDLGGQSLLAAQLVARIEQVFGKRLSLPAFLQAPTIEQLAKILAQEKRFPSWSSLEIIQPGGSKPPFIWVHGDESFGFLARFLGADQPLYGLEHQRPDGKPARYTQVETIAAHYLEEIRTVQSHGPYFLGGYSFGGTVAFEMAQQLKKQGEKVGLLILLDSHFPGSAIADVHIGSTDFIDPPDGTKGHLRNLVRLRAQRKLNYVLVRVKRRVKNAFDRRRTKIHKSIKKIVHKMYFAVERPLPFNLWIPYILDIYLQARLKYAPRSYPGHAIYIKSQMRSNDHQLAWRELMVEGMKVYEVPGDHLEIIKEPNAHAWAEKLQGWLDAAQQMAPARMNNNAQSIDQKITMKF